MRNQVVGSVAAAIVLLLRVTCRVRVHGDVRPQLREEDVPYTYALLHAHQISAVLVNDEARGRLAAMVSRSADGDVLVPSLRAVGVLAARGSSRRRGKDKGGIAALAELASLLEQRIAVLLAVDGPQGPRNAVHRGVTVLPRQVKGSVVLPVVVVPSRRWILTRTWDRMQVPKPFSTVHLCIGEPISAEPDESTELLRARISRALDALEVQHDPEEARITAEAARVREREEAAS
jgi:lysophospholipid acyltransferase (LPLAT)-like uncharacterized protein